ncbi:MAG: DUF3298 domain-containing protein [Muribaculaceae bacterium]|nr:DUF3298 domain-containing protein [Muribaculaceae bacterium]
MNKILIFVLTAVTILCSCSNGNNNADMLADNDTTLCQFSNIKLNKMYSYCDKDGDTTYFDNTFTALWPEIINGKPCDELQQALFRAMTDSAELNQLDMVADFLLNPASYTECDINRLTPVKAVKADEGKLSTSEVNVVMERMTDRLLTYRLSTYSYMAGGAHGIYANNYVTYDLDSCKAVTLADVIADTTLLRSTILKSIKQAYDYGTDDLFIPDNGLLPLPRDFFIQDQVLHAVYQVYEIASYAQGAIDAPIYPYMLKPEEMKRLFTPYGLQLIDYDF